MPIDNPKGNTPCPWKKTINIYWMDMVRHLSFLDGESYRLYMSFLFSLSYIFYGTPVIHICSTQMNFSHMYKLSKQYWNDLWLKFHTTHVNLNATYLYAHKHIASPSLFFTLYTKCNFCSLPSCAKKSPFWEASVGLCVVL